MESTVEEMQKLLAHNETTVTNSNDNNDNYPLNPGLVFDDLLKKMLGPSVLQEAISSVLEHLEPWVEEKKKEKEEGKKLSEADLARYEKMIVMYREVLSLFLSIGNSDSKQQSESESQKRIDSLLTEIQNLGDLPSEVMDKISAAGANYGNTSLNTNASNGKQNSSDTDNFKVQGQENQKNLSSQSSITKEDLEDSKIQKNLKITSGKTQINTNNSSNPLLNDPSFKAFQEALKIDAGSSTDGTTTANKKDNNINDSISDEFLKHFTKMTAGQDGYDGKEAEKAYEFGRKLVENLGKELLEESQNGNSGGGPGSEKKDNTNSSSTITQTNPKAENKSTDPDALGDLSSLKSMFDKEFGNDPDMQKLLFDSKEGLFGSGSGSQDNGNNVMQQAMMEAMTSAMSMTGSNINTSSTSGNSSSTGSGRPKSSGTAGFSKGFLGGSGGGKKKSGGKTQSQNKEAETVTVSKTVTVDEERSKKSQNQTSQDKKEECVTQ